MEKYYIICSFYYIGIICQLEDRANGNMIYVDASEESIQLFFLLAFFILCKNNKVLYAHMSFSVRK